ncbi:MAG: antA/AntB antirepressor family protein [Clostridiaceae bacterium]
MNKYEFIQNTDFITVSKTLENGGKSLEYNITIEMAKQLTMVEKSNIGTIARKYFIYIEKAFKGRHEWNKGKEETLKQLLSR